MKKVMLFFATFVAMAFVACNNDDLIENTHKATEVTVTAYTPEQDDSQTRVTTVYNSDEWNLSWSENDTFSVLRGSEQQTFTKTSGTNLFTGVLPQSGNGTYYATYPAIATISTTAVDPTAVSFDFSEPTQETQYLMYSSSESGVEYQFKHAVAYLKLTVNGFEGDMSKLTITTPNGVYTNGTIDLTTGELSGGDKNSVTLNFTENDALQSGGTINGIPIPPLAADNKTLTITVLNNNGKTYTATLAGEADKAIEKGKFYTAAVNVTELCYLPEGYTFRDEIAAYVTANYSSIKFFANSSTTSDIEIKCVSGAKAYVVQNLNSGVVEIHTKASKYVFDEDCSAMFSAYYNDKLQNLVSINFNGCCDTSKVTDMSDMFNTKLNGTGYGKLASVNVAGFDTSNVTNMSYMFFGSSNEYYYLTSLDLSSFNTSKVADMTNMFAYCNRLETLDLSSFILRTATCTGMFNGVGSNLPSGEKTQIKVIQMTMLDLQGKLTKIDYDKATYVVVTN